MHRTCRHAAHLLWVLALSWPVAAAEPATPPAARPPSPAELTPRYPSGPAVVTGEEGNEGADEEPGPIQAAGPKVEGLELPADRVVRPDQGYVFLTAKTRATKVRWLLLGNFPDPAGNQIAEARLTVKIPPVDGAIIVVYAVGMVGQDLTQFARTTITVKGALPQPPGPPPMPPNPPPPQPPQPPVPPPAPANAQRHVTVVLDLDAADNATALVLNSKTLRDWLAERKIPFRIYDVKAPEVTQRRLSAHLKQVNGKVVPTLIVQTEEWRDAAGRVTPANTPGARRVGVVRYADALPLAEDGFKQAVDSVLGGR